MSTHVTLETAVTDVTSVTGVTLPESYTGEVPGVTLNGDATGFDNKDLGVVGHRVTGVTPYCTERVCGVCGGDSLVTDARGLYCLTCRLRIRGNDEGYGNHLDSNLQNS